METPPKQDYRIYLVTRNPFDPRDEETEAVPRGGERIAVPRGEKAEVVPGEAASYIVQFVKPLTYEEQDRLRATYGLRLNEYVPNLAFLEWLEPQTREALSKDSLYRASTRYEAANKISPSISNGDNRDELPLRAILFPEFDPQHALEVISSLVARNATTDASEGGEGNKSAAARIQVNDDRPSGGSLQVVFAPLPIESLLEIAELREVRWIEQVARVNLNSPVIPEFTPGGLIQSGRMGDTPIWARNIQGDGQVIGVTDTPVNVDHCMFSDSNAVGTTHRKVVGNRQGPVNGDSHGHRVAALAAGFDPGGALSPIKGMAWMAKLSLDDSNEITSGSTNMFTILQRQADDRAFIHSNSWHEMSPSYTQIAVDVDNFVYENEEHFVCGSASNKTEELGPPGIAKNALCVSASKNLPNHLQFGDGVTGPINADDLRNKPEICAPGCQITTAMLGLGCGSSDVDGCASSWATPIIAGAAAMVRQYYLKGWYPSGTEKPTDSIPRPSGALIKATLLNSTVNMSRGSGYPSRQVGWGLVRLANTLFFAEEGGAKLFVQDIPNTAGLRTGESNIHPITVKDDSRPLKITLVWSDSPAQPNARIPLVNDLDLIVTAPDGKQFFGNNFDANGLSVEGIKTDAINNVEMVVRDQNLEGLWTITVSCAAANGATKMQGYALVVTAALG